MLSNNNENKNLGEQTRRLGTPSVATGEAVNNFPYHADYDVFGVKVMIPLTREEALVLFAKQRRGE